MPGSGFSEIGTVFVPVADADAALAFYVGKLGFEKRADFTYGDGDRWLEVAPPGAHNSLALVPTVTPAEHPQDGTLCALATADVEALHAALSAGGVDAEPIGRQGGGRAGLFLSEATVHDPDPPQFLFRDPDGNRFLAVQV